MTEDAATPTDWREALGEFERLQDLDPTARAAGMAALRATQPDLYARVQTLIRADGEAEAQAFMSGDACAVVDLAPGALVSAYRLERPLGSGGMGEVWLARRADGLFETPVALKLLHSHLARSSTLRERFVREGKILGELTHPNIARLLDAGVTPSGQMYLALEYIEGDRIDRWCDEHRLGIRDRGRMAQQVCAALAHAHGHLVVHRDVKPSNILVTASGEVKLLDFGIAKLVEDETGSGQTELTHLGGRALTPEYAAPEQITGGVITVATDVYSVGVLLYLLLSGRRPYGAHGSSPKQVEREVLETEPAPVSRAKQLNPDDQATELVARRRSTTRTKLADTLRGDLDVIVARALKKNPAERYPTIAALSEDLRRYLDHEPVLAQPDSLAYRARKFIRRNRVGVSAGAAVLVAIGSGVGVALWQAQVASLQSRQAQIESRKAQAVKDFLIGIFEQNNVNHPDGARARRTTAEELLAIGAGRIRAAMADVPDTRAELLGTIGGLYSEMQLQDRAIPLLREQVETLRQIKAGPSLQTAEALARLAYSLLEGGDYAAADATVSQSLAMYDALGDDAALYHAVARGTRGQIAYRLRPQDRQARRDFERGRDILARHHPSSHWHTQMVLGLSRVTWAYGDVAASEHYSRKALELALSPGMDWAPVTLATCYQNLGDMERILNRHAEAEVLLRKALSVYANDVGDDYPFALDARRELGQLLAAVGKRDEALRWLGEALQGWERAGAADDPELTAYSRLAYGNVLLDRGELAEAAPHIERAVANWRAAKAAVLGRGLLSLAKLRIRQGRHDEAARVLLEAEPAVIQVWGEKTAMHAALLLLQADLKQAQGKADEATALLQRVLTEWPQTPDDPPEHLVQAQLGLIRIRHAKQPQTVAARELLAVIVASPRRAVLFEEEAATRRLAGM